MRNLVPDTLGLLASACAFVRASASISGSAVWCAASIAAWLVVRTAAYCTVVKPAGGAERKASSFFAISFIAAGALVNVT